MAVKWAGQPFVHLPQANHGADTYPEYRDLPQMHKAVTGFWLYPI